MTMSRKLVGGMLALATGMMVGCGTPTAQTTQTNPTALTPDVSEASLTTQETTLEGQGYSIQQLGYTWFSSPRCRWFWVPTSWGFGWGYSRYSRSFDAGRWVLICNRRRIPAFWHAGPFATYGARFGRYGYDRTPPRHRPRYDRDRYDRYDRDRYDRGDRGGRMDDDDNGRDNRGGRGGGGAY